MSAIERRWPVGVRASEEWVAVPSREMERYWIWYGDIGEHGTNHTHNLFLYLRVREGFDSNRVVALEHSTLSCRSGGKMMTNRYCYEEDTRSREEVLVIETLPYRVSTTFGISV